MKTFFYSVQPMLLLLALLHSGNSMAKEAKTENTLSARQLVAAVLEANPRLEMAQAAWQASIAKIDQQSTLDDPQFKYSFAPFTIDSQGSNVRKTEFGQRFEISQKLPFPGKLHLRAKAAEYNAETRQQDIAGLQLLLASSAKSLFADWYFIHQAIAIDKLKQGLLKEYRDITMTQYSTGRAAKQDVLGAEMQLVQLKHQSLVLQRQRKTRLAQLNTLLNRPVDTPLAIPQQLRDFSKLPDLEQLQIKAMHSRPELKAIAANIKGYKSEADLAALAYYPDFKLSAGYNSLWDNEDKRFNIGVGINIPLDQTKRRAAEQEAKANSQQANWQQMDLQALIKQELTIAYALAEESLHVLRLYRQQLSPLADEKVAAAKADYQSGKGDFLSLINSKKDRLQTKLETEQALANVHRRFTELEQAVGTIETLSTLEQKGRIAQ
ncbi:MAG: TolC family protein [Methylophaga sp.]|nr:TolC family protein [Methylophaga sp.]